MKQHEAVLATLERLGGIATLGQLNQEVFKIKDCKWNTKTPFASIRRIVQIRPEIYRIRPGLWALESYKKKLEENGIVAETDENADSKEIKEFTHSYYQGLLACIGNMERFSTYVPPQDKNKKCVNKKLEDIVSIHEIPQFSYPELVRRSSTIDVIWFGKNSLGAGLYMPSKFFEVEHSTDIQNSLLKYNDLQDFNVDMIIVADANRKEEFNRKISYSAFDMIRKDKRVRFLEYSEVVKMYENKIERQKINFTL